MLSMSLNNTLLLDGNEFVRLYNENAPRFDFQKMAKGLHAAKIDNDYLTYLGYKINTRSTIFKDAISDEVLAGWNKVVRDDKFQDILGAFFDTEIYNYCRYLNGLDAYIVPSLELTKLCYWHCKSSRIPGSDSKLSKIRKEILGKSRVLINYSKSSESVTAYEDLLDSTCDLYSEMMFAVLSQLGGHNVTLDKDKDFIVDNYVAEVKSIHDRLDIRRLDANAGQWLQMSLPDLFTVDDLKNLICDQVRREKWICHLKKAIKKQKAKIIFFNATHSQELHRLGIFLEEKQLRKSFDTTLRATLSFVNNVDSVPVLVMVENIHEHHFTSFFCFLVPVISKNTNPELNLSRYTSEYIKNNIIL
jgi:hypothetical protein